MRLMEFLTDEEHKYLKQLMFDAALQALTTYKQQLQQAQLTQSKRIATKPGVKLKPQKAPRIRSLARKAKRPPQVPAPRALPKPKPMPAKPVTPVRVPAQFSTSKNKTAIGATQSTSTSANQPMPQPTALNPQTPNATASLQHPHPLSATKGYLLGANSAIK